MSQKPMVLCLACHQAQPRDTPHCFLNFLSQVQIKNLI